MLSRASQLLPRRYRKWFAAAEQSLLSAANFAYSLAVLYWAGVAPLGEYGFWFVMCQLMAMTAIGLTIRQMVLHASDSPVATQRLVFCATLRIVIALQLVQLAIVLALVALRPPHSNALGFGASLCAYVFALNLGELLRQYLYMRGRQRLSLVYTALGLPVGLGALVVVALLRDTENLLPHVFWFMALGHGIFAAIALSSMPDVRRMWAQSRAITRGVFTNNWRYGRIATTGMAVTWMQNQSITPMMMFMLGPLAVGYYQIARMVVMPISTITVGLQKSALPDLKRIYGNKDVATFVQAISRHRWLSLRVIGVYTLVVLVVWIAGASLGFVAESGRVMPLFIATIAVVALTNYRFWISQRFVVSMEFSILLRFGIIASLMTVIVMLIVGNLVQSALLVILSSAVGEIYLIVAMGRRVRLENAHLVASNNGKFPRQS